MGASAWSYWTDYDPDRGRAFSELRKRVFHSGAYLGPGGKRPVYQRGGRHPEPRPRTIKQVIKAQAENGTHTILDIAHFEFEGGPPRPMRKLKSPFTGEDIEIPLTEGGVCRLAAAEELRTVFGTDRPTRSQIEDKDQRGDMLAFIARWEALCVVAWDGERPVALYFCGISGD